MIDEKNIVSLSGGSIGGKGRGLAFINALIYNLDFSKFSKEINIRTPKTAMGVRITITIVSSST